MYRLKPQELVENRFLGLWSLLAFQAGFINSIGFLACQRYVSHLTGFGTQVGLLLGKGQTLLALEIFSLPASFIVGAWLNGHLTVARKTRGLLPRYDIITIMMPVCLLFVLAAGNMGIFGGFTEPLFFARDFLLLATLAFVCGLQNACFTTLTKGQIRTTHLTGISTDFGTDLSLILTGRLPRHEHKLAKRRNIMRAMTFLSFSVGATISAMVDTRLEYWSLSIPLATSIFVAAIFMVVKFDLDSKDE